MAHASLRWVLCILLSVSAAAQASDFAPPALPESAVATDAVREALAPVVRAAPPAPAQPTPAAQIRSAAVARAETGPAATTPARAAPASARPASEVVAVSPIRGRTAIARATAYNSLPNQTDSTPFITATGTRTRPGVVALSRDLLRTFPYGSKIMIEDLSGRYNSALRGRVFIVEDTMAARKTGSLDIWMSSRSEAMRFGARQIRITAVR
ncbi:3D domain-containing protein [Deinococcus koreensis]|uniref:3D domain-containing protein n=1 Tax=Deinococcus koreensis TaxID=2054903 RepID=UPI0013FD459C|nr:3D domain-containing protein [Deinococcus koreensis]